MQVVPNRVAYRVDGEAGRFEFETHSLIDVMGNVVFNSATELFPALISNEFYRTVGFKEIAYIYGDTEQSFRKTAELINRIRYQQEGGTPPRTLQESTQKEGQNIIDFVSEKTKRSLVENGFDENGQPVSQDQPHCTAQTIVVDDDSINEAAQAIAVNYDVDRLLDNPVVLEDNRATVNVSIDDVHVKRQKDSRCGAKDEKDGKRKFAHNTICQVEHDKGSYTLNAGSTKQVLAFLLAFLLTNHLTSKRVQFFTDGHRALNAAIMKFFSWHGNIGIVLDWYHLRKKCEARLSMAVKGKEIRNRILNGLMPLLWHGLTDKAIAHLKDICIDEIKNAHQIELLIEYLERNKSIIPCYAIRKGLGLRNGSSIGEKMNDLVVSNRQKNNGMSWSKKGSVALATVTALGRNKEFKKWFEEKNLEYALAA